MFGKLLAGGLGVGLFAGGVSVGGNGVESWALMLLGFGLIGLVAQRPKGDNNHIG